MSVKLLVSHSLRLYQQIVDKWKHVGLNILNNKIFGPTSSY